MSDKSVKEYIKVIQSMGDVIYTVSNLDEYEPYFKKIRKMDKGSKDFFYKIATNILKDANPTDIRDAIYNETHTTPKQHIKIYSDILDNTPLFKVDENIQENMNMVIKFGSTTVKLKDANQNKLAKNPIVHVAPKLKEVLDVSIEQLRVFAPKLSDEDLGKVQTLLSKIDVGNHDISYIMSLGEDLQRLHRTELMTALLDLTTNKDIMEAKELITELIAILEGFGQTNFLVRMFKEPKDIFHTQKEELDKRIKILSGAPKAKLMRLYEQVKEVRAYISRVSSLAKNMIQALSYVVSLKKPEFPEQLYNTRIESLMNTEVLLETNKHQVTLQMDMIHNLITNIQGLITADIPIWCNSYITACLSRNSSKTELTSKQKDIIENLKSLTDNQGN